MHLDRLERQPQARRYFAVRQSESPLEQKYLARTSRELIDRALKRRGELVGVDRLAAASRHFVTEVAAAWRGLRGRAATAGPVEGEVLAPRPAQEVDRRVANGGVEIVPCQHRRLRARAPHPETKKHVVHELLGGWRRTHVAPGEPTESLVVGRIYGDE
jgi:hypothetical protein